MASEDNKIEVEVELPQPRVETGLPEGYRQMTVPVTFALRNDFIVGEATIVDGPHGAFLTMDLTEKYGRNIAELMQSDLVAFSVVIKPGNPARTLNQENNVAERTD